MNNLALRTSDLRIGYGGIPHDEWRSSSSMIFWGVLSLTVVGLMASFFQSIYSVVDSIAAFLGKTSDITSLSSTADDAYGRFFWFHSNMTTVLRLFQLVTIAGWIAYVIGLGRFRNIQTTNRAYRLAGSLNSACWLGLISIGCNFIGGFLGIFGIVFSIAAIILMMISLFKFRGAFNRLTTEESWSEDAQRGASNLRTSYTYGIVLFFYPVICGIILLFAFISQFGNLLSDRGSDMLTSIFQFAGIGLFAFAVLGLIGIALWVAQVIYLMTGWNRINLGGFSKAFHQEIIVNENGEHVVAESEYEQYDEDEGRSTTRTWAVIGMMAACLVAGGYSIYFCVKPFFSNASYSVKPWPSNEQNGEDVNESMSMTENIQNAAVEMVQEKVREEVAASTSETGEYPSGYVAYLPHYSMRGTINGKYEIEMKLSKNGNEITGTYWYTKNKVPIQLVSETGSDWEDLILDEYVEGNKTGWFSGSFDGETYSGIWTRASDEKEMPFLLHVK